jgi:hypothetical protein
MMAYRFSSQQSGSPLPAFSGIRQARKKFFGHSGQSMKKHRENSDFSTLEKQV